MNTIVTIKKTEPTVSHIRGRDIVSSKLDGVYRPACVADGTIFIYLDGFFIVVPSGEFAHMPTTVWPAEDFLHSYKNELCLKIHETVNIEFSN